MRGQVGQPHPGPRLRPSTSPRRRRSAAARCAAASRPASARSSTTGRGPPRSVKTPSVADAVGGSMPAAAAVRLIWKSLRPSPWRGRGAAAARDRGRARRWSGRRSAPRPAATPPADQRQRAASAHGRLGRIGGDQPVGVERFRTVSAAVVRSTSRSDSDRSPVIMCGILIATWVTKPAMNTQAPK